MKMRLAGLAAALLVSPLLQAAAPLEASSEALRVDKAAAAVREQWKSVTTAGATVPQLGLPPLAQDRVEAMQRRNRESQQRRLQIGITRSIASEAVADVPGAELTAVAGGNVLRLDVVSPGAAGLRTALRVGGWPDGVQLRVAGAVFGEHIYAVDGKAARAQADAQGVFWTAATDGERQRLELFIPAELDPAKVVLAVGALSHLVIAPQTGAGRSKALGDSDSCNIDVICRVGTLGEPFVSIKNSVARMIFQSDGAAYTCTGTLVNDQDTSTQIPYFFTAHHCIGNQTEASSLLTFWNNETPSCGVDANGPNTQVGGGAQLLYSQGSTDGALLRLNNMPPGGAVLAGWNANALTPGTAVIGVHHPSGDIKKVSRGNHSGTRANVNFGGQNVDSTWKASWSEGTTEQGSSGSGLFTLNGSGYQLRGGLFGGGASCSNSGQSEAAGNVDFYSRLDQIFPSIQQYLTTPAAGPTRDYSGQWDSPGEGGRGLSLFSYGNVLFALWFVYDGQGRAQWNQLDPQWVGADAAQGTVLRWTGPAWGPNYDPRQLVRRDIGTFSLTFTSATDATFTYNVDGVSRTIPMKKLPY